MVPQTSLNFAAPITKIEWQASTTFTNAPFRQFELRLCHTSLSEFTVNFANNYDGNTPLLTHAANPLLITGAPDNWFGFDLTTSFDYNNRDNLIVELRWNNGRTETAADTWGWQTNKNWGLITKIYNGETGQLFSIICRFRLTYDDSGVEPTSLGRVKSLFR